MSKMPKMPNYVSTTNACKLCEPLGASLAFRGIEGAVPFLHGSQGCATYMRRYIISHFNEPIDIASSSLGEKHAVYGGSANLKLGLKNVTAKYKPQLIGVATTCLTETIGDDVRMIVSEYEKEFNQGDDAPLIISVSTPSYSGTHMEGFHTAIKGVVEQLSISSGTRSECLNILPGFLSAEDLRYLKEMIADFGIQATVLPDISDTLDGEALNEYPLIPKGGTPLEAIRNMGDAALSIECGHTLPEASAGTSLRDMHGVPLTRLGMPIGIRETDRFMDTLAAAGNGEIPEKYSNARGRLIDAMVDGHKYIFGKRAVIYGEEDLVVGLTSLLSEIGVAPILCASGGKSGKFKKSIETVLEGMNCEMPEVYENVDFFNIQERAEELEIDLLIGHSKGYTFAREKDIPLIRVGFPIHDRVGGQRLLHIGYHGAQALFDTITNTMIACKQDASDVGYTYM
ncbi:nitrogenase component 1 [Desulfopila sp. IMCC35008]|uniref:nitrogenase component 1 n=1 Tax=Desulfopila sp. IMCC35008 TaxID=2653858 RepID=UPI0013D81523|nr:nitrogenase component 1 [Desulfopila sp. IMCC35008]